MASIRSLACDGAGGEQDEAFGTGPAFSGGLLAETDDPEEVSQAMVGIFLLFVINGPRTMDNEKSDREIVVLDG
jgi:hypothetical protein